LTPETGYFLAKARRLLAEAEGMLTTMHYNEAAGRTGRAEKTHTGVRTEFHRLIRGDTRFDDTQRDFLGSTYNLKAIADYETGPGSDVSPGRAKQAIEEARLFIARISAMLEGHNPSLAGGIFDVLGGRADAGHHCGGQIHAAPIGTRPDTPPLLSISLLQYPGGFKGQRP
jgi:hypothetical protein